MKILVVEDDPNFLSVLRETFPGIVGDEAVVYASSRDSAYAAIEGGSFDLVVLDQKIPTTDGAFDAETEHGHAVRAKIMSDMPGTPIFFLTAFSVDDFADELLRGVQQADVWGAGRDEPLVRTFKKAELDKFLTEIERVQNALTDLNNVEIQFGVKPIELNDAERRLLRLFARRRSGSSIAVSTLTGGLSGTRVLKGIVKDETHAVRITAACRIGELEAVRHETSDCYPEMQRLNAGNYAPLVNRIYAGAGSTGGAFYSLLEYEDNFFEYVAKKGAVAPKVVEELSNAENPWSLDVGATRKTFRQIRDRVANKVNIMEALETVTVAGEEATKIRDILLKMDWKEFDKRKVNLRWITQHGDMHGANVLVMANQQPVLIDYMEVGEAPACLDPITLELSIVFHPDSEALRKDWPTIEQASHWNECAEFAKGSGYEDIIQACRKWASDTVDSDRAINATGFAFAMRQLKYPDTNKELALAIAKAAIDAFEKSYE